jgi:extracellular factor (EF) 3-hydroxypalmitic acid methyl ester biosynthesis protein
VDRAGSIVGDAAPGGSPARYIGADRLSPEYRDAIDATVALLESYRERVAARAAGPGDVAAAGLSAMVESLWLDWRALWSEASECLDEITRNANHLVAAKHYTEVRLTCTLLDAPLWRQAYAKPRGYPGDYMVMNYIYDGKPVGDHSYAQLVHALAVKIGQFVVRRKDFVRAEIETLIAAVEPRAALRVASLGCGPAREIVEVLAQDNRFAGSLAFSLIDQDEEALRCAGRGIADAVAKRRTGPRVIVEPRKVSVLRLLRDVSPADLFGQPDLIYSAGLFDYFSDRTCRMLTRRLYAALPPGGALLLGNMKAGTDMAWPLEFIADWSLTYRSAERVLSWAEGLDGADIQLRTEATGYDYMLRVRKPA